MCRSSDLEITGNVKFAFACNVVFNPGKLVINERQVELFAEVWGRLQCPVAETQIAVKNTRNGEPFSVVL